MNRKFSEMIPGVHYSVTPESQRMRRQRLQPEQIVEHLGSWRDRTEDGEFYAAIDLIKLTRYLQDGPAKRVELIDRILDILDEVNEVRHFAGPAGSRDE